MGGTPTTGVIGIPDFYEVDEEGDVSVVLDPDNPVPIDPERVPEHVDTERKTNRP